MGNNISNEINNKDLDKYSRPGVTETDIKNLRKAFNLLDSEHKGVIKYDLNRIKDVIAIEDESAIINFEQFMEIMSYNIQVSRSKYGNDKIVFESGK